jgi:hypothetical protein
MEISKTRSGVLTRLGVFRLQQCEIRWWPQMYTLGVKRHGSQTAKERSTTPDMLPNQALDGGHRSVHQIFSSAQSRTPVHLPSGDIGGQRDVE